MAEGILGGDRGNYDTVGECGPPPGSETDFPSNTTYKIHKCVFKEKFKGTHLRKNARETGTGL